MLEDKKTEYLNELVELKLLEGQTRDMGQNELYKGTAIAKALTSDPYEVLISNYNKGLPVGPKAKYHVNSKDFPPEVINNLYEQLKKLHDKKLHVMSLYLGIPKRSRGKVPAPN